MSGADGPGRLADRLLGVCGALLLAAMMLYGAVAVVQSIWLQLCIGAGIICLVWVAVWLFGRRSGRW